MLNFKIFKWGNQTPPESPFWPPKYIFLNILGSPGGKGKKKAQDPPLEKIKNSIKQKMKFASLLSPFFPQQKQNGPKSGGGKKITKFSNLGHLFSPFSPLWIKGPPPRKRKLKRMAPPPLVTIIFGGPRRKTYAYLWACSDITSMINCTQCCRTV